MRLHGKRANIKSEGGKMTDEEKREVDETSSQQDEVEDLEVGPDDAERIAGGKAALPSEHAI